MISSDGEYKVGEIKMKRNEQIILKKGLLFPKGLFEKPNLIPIRSIGQEFLRVNGLPYRGELELRKEGGKIYLLNILPLEEYLYSVVGCEIGPLNEKNFAAAKAQAIAARTYTIARMLANRHRFYHIYASPAIDQAYKGKSWETNLTRRAVEETRGLVMTNKGEVIIAYYHSTCGGWLNSKNKPYLKPLPDSPNHSPQRKPFCATSPHFSWKLKTKRKEFANLLFAKNLTIKKIILERDRKTKRVKRVKILTKQGNFSLAGEEFRKRLQLKSTLFEVKLNQDAVEIKGKGWGHGLGMCQSGALEMAKRGYSYQKILNHYYKGIKLEKIY